MNLKASLEGTPLSTPKEVEVLAVEGVDSTEPHNDDTHESKEQ
jgi:hypothetical protein